MGIDRQDDIFFLHRLNGLEDMQLGQVGCHVITGNGNITDMAHFIANNLTFLAILENRGSHDTEDTEFLILLGIVYTSRINFLLLGKGQVIAGITEDERQILDFV